MAWNNKVIGLIVGGCILVGAVIACIIIFSGGDDKKNDG
jgi:hypothetical protein